MVVTCKLPMVPKALNNLVPLCTRVQEVGRAMRRRRKRPCKGEPCLLCTKHARVSPVCPLACTHHREREMKNSILSQILNQDARARCMLVCSPFNRHVMSCDVI